MSGCSPFCRASPPSCSPAVLVIGWGKCQVSALGDRAGRASADSPSNRVVPRTGMGDHHTHGHSERGLCERALELGAALSAARTLVGLTATGPGFLRTGA